MQYKYDYSKLKGRIIEKFDSLGNFSKHLGKDESNVSKYLLGKCRFSQNKIMEWCEYLDIPANEISDYFFTVVVD